MDKIKKNNEAFRTLLIFPPVWSPVTPYLALPVLVAYLRKQGLSTRQYDASLDFFTRYLLKPDTLLGLLKVIFDRDNMGDYADAPNNEKALLNDLKMNQRVWKRRISQVENQLESMRQDASFYEPESCIRAQNNIYDLLRLASLSYFPTVFTFNTFSNPTITDFTTMVRFCDDVKSNPFFEFYSEKLLKRLERERPSLIGISVSTSYQLGGALTMARFVKKAIPSVHVTLGGKHIPRLKESFIREPAFFPEFCDSLVMDNGERPLKKLIEQLEIGGPLHEVPNLAYFHQDRLVFNPNGPHEPMSELPTPDFSDLPLNEYLAPTPIIPIRLSEGCYWGKCTFCSRFDNKRFQTVPPQKAVMQMEELQKQYQVSCFTINDDCLTPTYLEALSRAIIAKNLHFQISLWCKPVGPFSLKRLKLLSAAGVKLIRWGLETGHRRILKLMNKGTNLEETLRVLKDSSKAGIWNHGTMIIGFPTEKMDEAMETLRFLEQGQEIIHSSIFFRFVLLNHSYIFEHPEAFDIESITEKNNLFSYEHDFICSQGMDQQTVSSFLSQAQKYRLEDMYGHPFWFYLRIREYLLLYVARYGLEKVKKWKVRTENLSVYTLGEDVKYFFQKPEDVPPDVLEKIYRLIESGGEVGVSWIKGNLRKAFLIGYAAEQGRIIGTMTHKKPLKKYVRQIEERTDLDLRGYLERGYTYVRPEYRGLGVGDRLLKGLVERSPGKKIYVTINMDNLPPVKLTLRNKMRLAATYTNEKTGHKIGVFTNQY
jgi:anaerobic magnesium-protoporphyrin IX monomethyl ester cyclase